jgi:SH3-like domain-containing protein
MTRPTTRRVLVAAILSVAALTAPFARADQAVVTPVAAAGAATGPAAGPVTNLPLPRFVSLKAAEGNVRRGPSLSHRIDWVFRRRDMPLQVTAEFENWRRVQDQDGQGGWIHYALLSGVRTVVVTADMADLLARPEPQAMIAARAEPGVIARLGECLPDWCRISAGGTRGWVRKDAIWGVGPDELRD